jgi:hypothetical protein
VLECQRAPIAQCKNPLQHLHQPLIASPLPLPSLDETLKHLEEAGQRGLGSRAGRTVRAADMKKVALKVNVQGSLRGSGRGSGRGGESESESESQ